ncbi:short-chain dehydrogenase-like protein 16 [Elsinoe australis]|uniref:Short-chain dehydrogenase-like protein 16 n=1 Tax=Elsinoe australis TaxID=40998 RepID=A0A4U7ASX7_9PEZI|nr:short-chain dehydrogenase-like protein 16 [Elsinoe australis]
MAASKQIVLITGANKGIGLELARQLLADSNKHVLLGSRSVERGEAAVKELESQKQPGTVELLTLDVTKEDSINAAAEHVESQHGKLDVLVNNAGIYDPKGTFQQSMQESFLANATGTALMGDAFLSLLKKSSSTPRILNVSSGLGSVAMRLDSKSVMNSIPVAIQYRASKAAMNMISADQAVRFGEFGIKVFAYCPGFTVSTLHDMNKAENGARATADSVAPMVKVLNGERDAEHGGFLHDPEGQYPW